MNLAVLKMLLETDSNCTPHVASGNNTPLLAYLNGPHTSASATVRIPLSASVVRRHLAPVLKSLPEQSLARLRVLLSDTEELDLRDPGIRQELDDLIDSRTDLTLDPAPIKAAVLGSSRRKQTVAEQAGAASVGEIIRLEDLVPVLDQIATSQRSRYLRNEFAG